MSKKVFYVIMKGCDNMSFKKQKELSIIDKIYLIENGLNEKMLNTYLNKYYGGKTLEELQPFQQNKILSWMQSCAEREEMGEDNINTWALEHGYF